MRKIIFDTDLGSDCDDVVALTLLVNAHKKKEIELCGVACNFRAKEGANCCRAILKELDMADLNLSAYPTEVSIDTRYGYKVSHKFPELAEFDKPFPNSVRELRKLIANNPNVEIVATGNFTNLFYLLQSEADDISPLNGTELVKKNVSVLYTMAGNFTHYTGVAFSKANVDENGNFIPTAEYNIYCDGKAAAFVCENWPTEVIFLPFEVGHDVISGKKIAAKGENTPDGYSMIVYGAKDGRCSWDPMTAFYALYGGENWANFTESGKVSVDENDITNFTPSTNGKHKIIKSLKISNEKMAELIESYLGSIINVGVSK